MKPDAPTAFKLTFSNEEIEKLSRSVRRTLSIEAGERQAQSELMSGGKPNEDCWTEALARSAGVTRLAKDLYVVARGRAIREAFASSYAERVHQYIESRSVTHFFVVLPGGERLPYVGELWDDKVWSSVEKIDGDPLEWRTPGYRDGEFRASLSVNGHPDGRVLVQGHLRNDQGTRQFARLVQPGEAIVERIHDVVSEMNCQHTSLARDVISQLEDGKLPGFFPRWGKLPIESGSKGSSS